MHAPILGRRGRQKADSGITFLTGWSRCDRDFRDVVHGLSPIRAYQQIVNNSPTFCHRSVPIPSSHACIRPGRHSFLIPSGLFSPRALRSRVRPDHRVARVQPLDGALHGLCRPARADLAGHPGAEPRVPSRPRQEAGRHLFHAQCRRHPSGELFAEEAGTPGRGAKRQDGQGSDLHGDGTPARPRSSATPKCASNASSSRSSNPLPRTTPAISWPTPCAPSRACTTRLPAPPPPCENPRCLAPPLLLPPRCCPCAACRSTSIPKTACSAPSTTWISRCGPGRTLAIVGESGSGKSVTSMAIMRLTDYTSGRIATGQILFRDGADRARST
jgi:hypothetical protein